MMISSLLSDITTQLSPISDTPALDASVLIAHIIHKPRTWVMAHPELTLTAEQQGQLHESLARLESGEPFPYVLSHWEFFGLEFEVTPDVLIPRPETELLVEKAIVWLQESPAKRTVADVGTGSGVIAISIAKHVPDVCILATDISHKALEVAQRNACKFNVEERIEFIECDLLPHPFAPLPVGEGLGVRVFDLICANLPYIPSETLRNLPIFGREPSLALDGGPGGLDLIRRLLILGPECLAPQGMMLLEVEATRGKEVLNLACDIFPEEEINLHQDLSGQDRVLEIIL
jgi:release factor glutamine methyltransferase